MESNNTSSSDPLASLVDKALFFEKGKNGDDNDGPPGDDEEDIEMSIQDFQTFLSQKSDLRGNLVNVPEWEGSILGVFFGDEGPQTKDNLLVLVKIEHPLCAMWIEKQCEEQEGGCMYMISKIDSPTPPNFTTTDVLMNERLTEDMRKTIIHEVFTHYADLVKSGEVRFIKEKKLLQMCKLWRVKRSFLKKIDAVKDVVPTDQEMLAQFVKRQEGGGAACAIPLTAWNTGATAYLKEKVREQLPPTDVQKEAVAE